MASNVPALQPELRALEMMHDLPVDHWLMQSDSDRHAPHLKAGEWAVVSPDAELVVGELHVVMQSNGPSIWALLPVPAKLRAGINSDEPLIYKGNLWRPRRLPNGDLDLRGPIHFSDGVVGVRHIAPAIIGRVVGVYCNSDPLLLMPVLQTLSMHHPAHDRYPAWLRKQHSAENAARRAEPWTR